MSLFDQLRRLCRKDKFRLEDFHTEIVAQVLTNAEKWVQPTSDNGKSTELRLQLNREPPQQKAPANP